MAHPDLPDTDMLYARLLQLAFPLVLSEGDTDLLQQCYAQLVERTIPPSPLQPRLRTSSHGSRSSRPSRGHVVYESGKQVCVCVKPRYSSRSFKAPTLSMFPLRWRPLGIALLIPRLPVLRLMGETPLGGPTVRLPPPPPTHTITASLKPNTSSVSTSHSHPHVYIFNPVDPPHMTRTPHPQSPPPHIHQQLRSNNRQPSHPGMAPMGGQCE